MATRKVQIALNRRTAAEWAARTEIPLLGEPCWATDSKVLKIGDGANVWSGLTAVSGTTDAAALTSGTLDGDRLPALSTTKKGGVPATGAPAGLFLKDDGTWGTPAGGAHDRQHAITATADHTSTATAGKLLKADTNGLPADATNTESQVSAAVSASHANTNDPTADQKAALAGTSGTAPSASNKYVDNADTRNTNARTPSAHKTSHEPGGADAMAVDAAAVTGSLRTIGTGALTACAGNDARLSDARTPSAHKTSHEPGGTDAMTVDAAAATGSLRTLGTGATAACAGNDARLSDARTPTSHNHAATEITSGSLDGDRLAAPTTSKRGGVKATGTPSGLFLRDDDSWASPAGGSHDRQHAITATADHTSTATSGQMLRADANGLPVDASNTNAEVAAAVTASHAALHAASHASGAADAVKIDDLAAGDDNTDLNASTTKHGLAIKATAPAAGIRNVLAIDNAETAYKNAALVDDTNPAALGTAGPGTSLVAARRDHVHAMPAIDATAAATDITTRDATTSAHGLVVKATAPSAGLLNVVGIANAETSYANKALYDATNPAALGTAAPGSAMTAARRDHVHTLPAIDATAAATDITDRNVSTSAHGLVPKAPNNTYQMLRADATWARPRSSAYATTSSATPTPDADVYDTYELTALAEAAAFAAPSGTPVNGQKLLIRILDNGTARALTWNSIYAARGAALPSTTVQSKVHHIGFIYSSNKTKWDCVVATIEA